MEKYFVTRVLSLLSEKLTIRVIKCRLCNSDISENFFLFYIKKIIKKKKTVEVGNNVSEYFSTVAVIPKFV